MNSAVDNTSSSTVQGGNVYNMAVEYHTPNVGAIVSDRHSTNIGHIAETTAVLDDQLKPSGFTR